MSDGTTVITDADLAAVSKVPQRIIEAWGKNDADAFAAVFTEDGTLILPGDVFLKSRAEVRAFMARENPAALAAMETCFARLHEASLWTTRRNSIAAALRVAS